LTSLNVGLQDLIVLGVRTAAPSVERYTLNLTLINLLENGETSVGTGFLVNFRDSAKDCIMTAGHNIVNKACSVNKIEASFPRGEKMTALGNQCFVSKIYKDNPDEVNDKDDYALIAVPPGDKKLGGFGFSAVIPENQLIQGSVFVYGYASGGGLQGFESSLVKGKLKEKPRQLFHSVKTQPGVSGGPVWIKHQDDYYTAIGIQ
jgi:V8-like Glu-specific endopeptidase